MGEVVKKMVMVIPIRQVLKKGTRMAASGMPLPYMNHKEDSKS